MFIFFFSSRRRHTRCYRDWSSDVCSSDLGQLHRVENLRVAGTAAEIAGQGDAHLVAARGGIVLEESLGSEENAWGAIAALGGAELREGLLKRMEPASVGHP